MGGVDLLAPKKHHRGYTIPEILVVVGIIALLVLIAIPQLLKLLHAYEVQSAASGFAVHLRFARNAAVKQKLRYRILIAESPDNAYRLERETNYGSGDYALVPGLGADQKLVGGARYIALPSGITIEPASTDGPIVFNFRGANDGATTYNILMETTDVRYTITVTPSGGISTLRTVL